MPTTVSYNVINPWCGACGQSARVVIAAESRIAWACDNKAHQDRVKSALLNQDHDDPTEAKTRVTAVVFGQPKDLLVKSSFPLKRMLFMLAYNGLFESGDFSDVEVRDPQGNLLPLDARIADLVDVDATKLKVHVGLRAGVNG